MICPYCKKDFNNVNCHKPRCKSYQETMIKNSKKITKKELYNFYVNKEYSIQELVNKFNVNKRIIINKLKEYDIQLRVSIYTKRRNKKMRIKKQNYTQEQNKIINEKREKTCLEKYGVKNVSLKTETIDKIKKSKITNIDNNGLNSIERQKEKFKQTCLKKYGVDNTFKDKIIIKKILKNKDYQDSIKKSFKTKIKKYGTPYTFTLNKSNGKRLTSPVKKIKKILLDNNIDFIIDYYIPNSKFYVDFYIPQNNLIIEVYGDYWHCNPRIYNKKDIVKFKKGNSNKAKEIWDYDKNREKILKKLGYKFIKVWEYDINKDLDKIEKQILNTYSLYRRIINFIINQCTVKYIVEIGE